MVIGRAQQMASLIVGQFESSQQQHEHRGHVDQTIACPRWRSGPHLHGAPLLMWHALLCITLGVTVGGSVVTAPYMTVSPFRQVEDVLPKLVERRRKLDAEAAAAYVLRMAEVL